ncbi:MAG: primosomal protein N' [Thermoflavifilum sp.]|nr:primosomal protein N' [Thermoflavifilum sp.]MCL6513309.1 primosomal protein N' [Alicyclobacillus sp.]
MTERVAEVVVHVRTRALDRTFDYRVPPAWADRLQPGQRVFVSFGRRWVAGLVWRVKTVSAAHPALKPIHQVLDDEPLLTPPLLAVCEYLTDRYACTLVEAVEAVLPGPFRTVERRVIERGEVVPQDEELREAWAWLARPRTFEQLERRYGLRAASLLSALTAIGAAREVAVGRDAVTDERVPVLRALAAPDALRLFAQARERRAPVQAALARALVETPELHLHTAGRSPSERAVQALVEAGLAEMVWVSVYRKPAAGVSAEAAPPELTPWQRRALDRLEAVLEAGGGRRALLHGVTGSGKTELYLRLIGRCLEAGGGAIVLVPEIALTPQLVGRFEARFGDAVAVLHSGLSDGERRDEWLRLRRGEARIAVGARSAVFAPVQDLKLIIIDEEHEPAYKQEDAPYYDARDVARWRAEHEGAVVILGSATPSLHAMSDVQRGKMDLAVLPVRVTGQPLPPVEIVDMREALRSGERGILSRQLQQGVEEACSHGRQALLFLNRRGLAAFVLCRGCGHVPVCPHCDISLTVHREGGQTVLVCHYCQHREPLEDVCPVCREPALRPFGIGTQQLEEVVRSRWPQWRVLRLDVDTARRKGAHGAVVQAMLNREVDILIGTQMIAKGLDFPGVAFVGVVSADTMLAVPDYRAAERTFQLLAQVAGRAGRAGDAGRTVIQTYRPEHYAIQAAAHHDYNGFFERELKIREAFGYPPFSELAVFRAMHSEERWAQAAASRFERELRRASLGAGATVLPAVPAGVRRVHDQFRYQVVVKYLRWDDVRDAVRAAFDAVMTRMRKVGGTCALDVDAARI